MNKEIKKYILKYKLLKHLLIMLNMRDFIFFYIKYQDAIYFLFKKIKIKSNVRLKHVSHFMFPFKNQIG